MLYLEDYLEMIEHLPQELRDRFTEMREMDLRVQNAVDSLDERVKHFFSAAKKMKPAERDAEYETIRQDYYKALEDADEKVHIANQMYELVERYIRRLNQELQKFKMELEADNAGITQVLEQRSYELDKPLLPTNLTINNIKGEKRKHSQISTALGHPTDKQLMSDKVLSSLATEVMRETMSNNRLALTGHSPSSSSTSSSCSVNSIPERNSVLNQTKGHTFGGGNALAAAASQAIAATQQSLKRTASQNQSNILQQGRRTASLKASYDAINTGFPSLSKEFTLGTREMPMVQTIVTNAMAAITPPNEARDKTKTKKTARSSITAQLLEPPSLDDSEDSSVVDEANTPVDWTYDPSEPRYCICNQVSYGDMVACDNVDCPFEWFHYPCVHITQPPKGKWYCPQCTSSMKRRGRKEK